MNLRTLCYTMAVLIAVPLLMAADKEEFKATCPVAGKPAKESSSVEYKGKKVYFCCNNCPKAFAANPEKFAAKADAQLVETGQAIQFACPLTGRPVNPDKILEVGSVKVGVCCAGCQGKVEATSGDARIALVFKTPEKGFTLQTICPVSGKKIDPTKYTEYKGQKVFFCCGNCLKAFEGNPEKFADKLPKPAKKG